MTISVQNHGDDKMVHPNSKTSVSAIGTKLRLRLSNIFHHDKSDKGFLRDAPFTFGIIGITHGSSCQSPRTQRCRRFTSVL